MTITKKYDMISMSEITPDPDQPRRTFGEQELEELTQSIKGQGLLQPILLRPNPTGKGYIIVFGERRFRACARAGMTIIPAEVKQLTPDEIKEIQISENSQRAEVHPMEEAAAFKALSLSVEELAIKLGRSEYYVRRRIQLNNLTDTWKQLFLNDKIAIKHALAICRMPADAQDVLHQYSYNERTGEVNEHNFTNTMRNVTGHLGEAFDMADKTLNPKMGSCHGCKFNSATASLFPDDAKEPRCSFISCFSLKSDNSFERELTQAKLDPKIIFLKDGYQTNEFVDKLKAEGLEVYGSYEDYNELGEPELQSKEDFQQEVEAYGIDIYEDDDQEDDDQDDDQDDDEAVDQEDHQEDEDEDEKTYTQEQLDAAYLKVVEEYKNEMAEYQQKIAGGAYPKGFIVCGRQMGKYIYVKLRIKSAAADKDNRKAVEAGGATDAQIDAEITRLRDREKRNRELDSQKVHVQVKEILGTSEAFMGSRKDDKLAPQEITGIVAALHEAGGATFREWLKEQYGIERYSFTTTDYAKISGISVSQMNQILSIFMRDKLFGTDDAPLTNGNALAVHEIAKLYHGDLVTAAIEGQQVKADKRNERVDQRISELKKQKKAVEVTKPAKAKKKKTDMEQAA